MADETNNEPQKSDAKDRIGRESELTDRSVRFLRNSGSGASHEEVTIEAAILTAQSNRELGAVITTAAETLDAFLRHAIIVLDSDVQLLALKIDTFTDKADKGTDRLATWTKYLAFATLALVLATAALVYVEFNAEPQIIVTPTPTSPPVVVTPALPRGTP